RLIGEHIRLVVRTPAPPLWMMADPGQLGQIVMNLSLNARDAMSPGGTLEIETAAVTVGEDDPAPRSLAPGRYVLLRVEDTGEGMEPEVLAHCFEPFFTTKDVGRGTGLGLATVFGIVQRTGGHIRARSALGVGTAFEIHWPVEEHAVAVAPNAPEPESARPGGVETILLVEDEDAIRRLARSVLETKGYRVFEAADGIAALEWSEAHTETVQLLVTDVVMPRMGGRRLAEKLSSRVPGLRVLFVSGHTEDTLLGQGVEKGVPFLHKPFTPAELLRKVRDVLDAKITHLP
ncbi:MAG: response regulator, partial [Candidatus Eisenbacteria bacterium]|nr:response regulator [Candidatus Eisenbacteria bacterium]